MTFEELGQSLFERCGSRDAVSLALGYFPAWKAFELKDTFGLPLIVTAMEVHKHGLKMDYLGLRYEFAKHGADGDAEVAAVKREMELVA
jgi:alanyl-tRNA synthetase